MDKIIDGRKIKGKFKMFCQGPHKEKTYFMAQRKNARYCDKCRKYDKYFKDLLRNQKNREKRIKNKIVKKINDEGLYEQLIQDISNEVIKKMDYTFHNLG